MSLHEAFCSHKLWESSSILLKSGTPKTNVPTQPAEVVCLVLLSQVYAMDHDEQYILLPAGTLFIQVNRDRKKKSSVAILLMEP